MYWRLRLRLFWYRTDKVALASILFLGLIVALLGFGLRTVFAYKDAHRDRIRELHAQSLACLARNVYFEARGEPVAGQYAVAEVTMNRAASGRHPGTVCEVVYEKSAFSWTDMSGLPEPEGEAWQRAQDVAEAVYYRRHTPALKGALFFHATYVDPDWAKEKKRIARIGKHIFYR